jgi:hypothetical protein
LPFALARAIPACTRSTIMPFSNSAKTPSIRNIALPAGVEVSIACRVDKDRYRRRGSQRGNRQDPVAIGRGGRLTKP